MVTSTKNQENSIDDLIDFDKHFPVLISEIKNLEETTGFTELR